ncbi:centromere protein L-like [Bufo bufo]|uniref:centromere protein L-like n=1 Tax=Bufo bufo TaxID=8384 RepID=UPI001ABE23C0|nr:centromere protein L-like [Bufo bufo]
MQTPTDGVLTPRSRSSARRSSHFHSSRYPPGSMTSARRWSALRSLSKRKIPQCTPLKQTLDPAQAALLLQKQWTLFSMTPMYNFSYIRLKEYSNHLSAHKAAEKHKGLAIEVASELNLKAKCSCLPGLKGKDRDPLSVLIQISSNPLLIKAGTQDQIVWTSWFCGTYTLEVLPKTYTCLQLFLYNISEALMAILGTWFQRNFDCFGKLVIIPQDLMWLAVMWTGYDVFGSVSATELVFSVPVEPRMDISYAIHAEDFKTLWNYIHKSKDKVTLEEVDNLFQCLHLHFFRDFRIHLSATQLIKG